MENPDIINTNEQCDSPVYVETSPVSSPVFVSKETEHESLTQFMEKLILPTLNDDLLLSNTTRNNVTNVEDNNVSATTIVTSSPSNASSVEHVSVNIPETTTEMVTIVVKDFKYCQE